MNVHFESIPFLQLIGLGALGVLFVIRTIRRPRAFGQAFFRLCALICLALSAAHPTLENRTEHQEGLALIDLSASIEDGIGQSLLDLIPADLERANLPLLPFSKKTAPLNVPSNSPQYTKLRAAWGSLDTGGTNLEEALERVAATFSGNLLLASDGWETEGAVERTFQKLREHGVRVFPLVPKDQGLESDFVGISNIDVPMLAPTGSAVPIRVSVKNSTSVPRSGVLEVFHDGKKVLSRSIEIETGREVLLVAESDPSKEGIKEVTAVFKPADESLTKTSRTALLSVEQRERVQLLSGTREDEDALQQVLTAQGYQLKTMRGSEGKVRVENFAQSSAIILNNIPFQQLASDFPRQLVDYVERGGKLVMVGGNKSFGLGGYIATPIERILPVTLVPPMTEAKRLNVAVELVFDKSQSMAADSKLDFAKEAGREVVRNLKDEDLVGVIGFDDAPFIALPLGQVAINRALALERIGRIYPKGKTYLFPALDESRRALMRVNAGRKHILVLTDGKLPDGGPFYLEFVRQLRVLGITVSTVLLGEEVDTALLKSMADLGGGAFYQTNDPRNLPRIFMADIRVASGERTMKERTEYVVKRGPSDQELTQLSAFPPLLGYVQTRPKDGAELDLLVTAEGKADPLLAHGRVGKGNVVAFTSDANGRWSNNWVRWARFSQFWVDILGDVSEDTEKKSPRFELRPYVDRGKLVLDLSVFSEDAVGAASGTARDSSGKIFEVAFAQIASGRYQAVIDRPIAGRYDMKMKVGAHTLTPVAFLLSGELFSEQRGKGFNFPLLEAIAQETGGRSNPTSGELRDSVSEKVDRQPLNQLTILSALLFFLFEILTRERTLRRARPRKNPAQLRNVPPTRLAT